MGADYIDGKIVSRDVNIQDQHTRALDLKFIQGQAAPTTLTVQAEIGDTELNLTSATGFVDENVILMVNPDGNFYIGKQVGAPAVNVITLDTPIDSVFTIANTSVLRASENMNVVGTLAAPQIFAVGPVGGGTGIEVDITRIMGNILDATAMDDGLFGALTKLTNGVVLRHNNTVIQNIWNVKSNGEFRLLCYDVAYATKAPSGLFGVAFRNTFAGQSKHGVTLRLEPGDILELLIQDDLSGLNEFKMMAQGHIVE